MADESLREIQLNGKQLVFVFMAATVVAVVIFLSGVMVGRTAPQGVALAASLEEAPASGAAPGVEPSAPLAAAPVDGPVAANEDLDYPDYLNGAPPDETFDESFDETFEGPVESTAEGDAIPDVAAAPAEVLVVERPAEASPGVAAIEPAADEGVARPADPGGWVVQVAAVSERPAAEAIAADLTGKGYRAFVTTPGADAPLVFRVRVGSFPDRREAESIAGRLEREEQFRPWVTR